MKLFKSITGTGPTVLLIHGIISDHSYFDDIIPFLGLHYRVICYDRRGYGLDYVALDREDYSLETQADDAIEILCEEKEPAVIVAHSAGSVIALEVVKKNPSLVRGLILVEPALGCDEADKPVLDNFHMRMTELADRKKILPALTLVARAGGECGSPKKTESSFDNLLRTKRNLSHFMYKEIRELYRYRIDPEEIKNIKVPVCLGITDSVDAMYSLVTQHDAAVLDRPYFLLPKGHNCFRSEPAISAKILIKEINLILNYNGGTKCFGN